MIVKAVVVSYLIDRAFGFLRYEGNEENIFFHRADYQGPVPKVDQLVECTLIEDIKGRLKAVKVKPLAGATMPWSEDPRHAHAPHSAPSPRVRNLLADERDSQHDFGITVETPKDGI